MSENREYPPCVQKLIDSARAQGAELVDVAYDSEGGIANCGYASVSVRKDGRVFSNSGSLMRIGGKIEFAALMSSSVTEEEWRKRHGDFQMSVDKPFEIPRTVREMIEQKRAAGHDGVFNDPEAVAAIEAVKDAPISLAAAAKARDLVELPTKINHHTRTPNQPTEATIVEGEYCNANNDLGAPVPYSIKLTCKAPGTVEFTLTIDNHVHGRLPFDNLVKAATRVDPDHAIGPERQIRGLRQEVADANARMYEWQSRAILAEERVAVLEGQLKAFQEASKA
jgi:hypothetical protein